MNQEKFSKQFYWGASTASHQVEGGNINQWTVWELAHAKALAKTAHERLGKLPSWVRIRERAENPDNYVSGRGVAHYERYKEDFAIARRLNLNAWRFGIEWSRLEPEEGQWDATEIEHYRQYIRQLKKDGLEPFLNIWHWTMPVWFADKGGFEKRSNLKYFDRFVEKIGHEYARDLKYILTINEPNVYSTFSYLAGIWPPGELSFRNAVKVMRHLVLAHRHAYKILKQQKSSLQIGVATQLSNIQAKMPRNILDELSVKAMRYVWNWWFLNRIKRYQDFVGFNYYFSDYYTQLFRRENPRVPTSDLGWYMEPEGLYPLLLRVWQHYKKPIFVTENGVADEKDDFRQWWLEETMIAMQRATSEGVDLRGYFHWSLLDNFEWAYGWWPKFGLVAVDRQRGMKRTVRPSAVWWANEIKKSRR